MKVIETPGTNYPKVRVTRGALKSAGGDIDIEPEILDGLIRDNAGLQRSYIRPRLIMYGRCSRAILLGLHVPFTRTIFVQVPAAARSSTKKNNHPHDGIIQIIAHEAAHLADSWQHPVRAIGEIALRSAYIAAGMNLIVNPFLASPGRIDRAVGNGLLFGLVSLYYLKLDPREIRARKLQYSGLEERYSTMISSGLSPPPDDDYENELNTPPSTGLYDWRQYEDLPYDWRQDGE